MVAVAVDRGSQGVFVAGIMRRVFGRSANDNPGDIGRSAGVREVIFAGNVGRDAAGKGWASARALGSGVAVGIIRIGRAVVRKSAGGGDIGRNKRVGASSRV